MKTKMKNFDIPYIEEAYELNLDLNNLVFNAVESIENKVVDKQMVYDLEIEDQHNYIVPVGIAHNGGGRRMGSFAIYLEPWHGDVMDFLDLKKNHGNEEMRARDLFYGVWMPDLFMQRVEQDLEWSLMCPNQCPGLDNVYAEAFVELYEKYESEGKYLKKVKARDVWYKILEAQMETGTPYILYKDSINKKSNQANIGTIVSSNLCLAGSTKVDVRFTLKDNSTRDMNMSLKQLVISQKRIENELNGIPNDVLDVALIGVISVDVLSFNTLTKAHEYKQVMAGALMNKSAQVMRITNEVSGHTITCTPEHQVFTSNRGYVMAKDLMATDTLLIEQHQHKTAIKIELLDEKIPVYDITVEGNQNFFANKILVHNCAEIVEVTTGTEDVDPITGVTGQTAVCNLASVCLPKFVKVTKKGAKFDFVKLYDVTYQATINLNKVIDINYYPTARGQRSNKTTRPIAIGIQGLADVYFLFSYAYESDDARHLNLEIAETMYYAALKASNDLAKKDGSYDYFDGSPASKGILQFDMWNVKPSNRYDWDILKNQITTSGLRNSLTTSLMPTASCFSSEGIIRTSKGNQSYQEIMHEQGIDWRGIEATTEQRWIKFETPLRVETRFGLKESTQIFYNGHKETLNIEMEDGTVFTCTYNHKFLVERQGLPEWVESGDLSVSERIISENNNVDQPFASQRIMSITDGQFLPTWDIEVNDVHEYITGNGCVSHNTASIWGNEASAEAQTSNMYTRRVLAGEFICVNKHLVKELVALGLWGEEMRQLIIAHEGSVQGINSIPASVKEVYKTVWEISQKAVIDQYAERGAFIDQTQSMNIYMSDPNFAKLTSMHFYGWGLGTTRNDNLNRGEGKPAYGSTPEKALKTGIYYLRSQSGADAVKFTVDATMITQAKPVVAVTPVVIPTSTLNKTYTADEQRVCSIENPSGDCLACGS